MGRIIESWASSDLGITGFFAGFRESPVLAGLASLRSSVGATCGTGRLLPPWPCHVDL
jgi:hypothetical protein